MGNTTTKSKEKLSSSTEGSDASSGKDFTYHQVLGKWRIDEGYGDKYDCFTGRALEGDGYYIFTLKGKEDEKPKAVSKWEMHTSGSEKPQDLRGWKIHISLQDFEDVKTAWNLIFPLLEREEVYTFKVRFPKPPTGKIFQKGKDIVIYHAKSKESLPWGKMLEEIEAALKTELGRDSTGKPIVINSGETPSYRIGELFCDGKEGRPKIDEPSIDGRFLFVERDDIVLKQLKSSEPYRYVKVGAERGAEAKPIEELRQEYGPFQVVMERHVRRMGGGAAAAAAAAATMALAHEEPVLAAPVAAVSDWDFSNADIYAAFASTDSSAAAGGAGASGRSTGAFDHQVKPLAPTIAVFKAVVPGDDKKSGHVKDNHHSLS